jgi:uncharacterized membrane protein
MQSKGSKYTIFDTHQIPPNLHFASLLAKQNIVYLDPLICICYFLISWLVLVFQCITGL